MIDLAYNNDKNTSIGYTFFELNYGYNPCVFYKEEEILDLHSNSKTAKELSSELQELMIVYQQNFHHAQNLKKQVYNKGVKLQNNAPSNKIWLNSKHFKN